MFKYLFASQLFYFLMVQKLRKISSLLQTLKSLNKHLQSGLLEKLILQILKENWLLYARPGVTAGKAAGMKVVAVPSVPKQSDLFTSADEVINSLLDLQLEKWGLPAFEDCEPYLTILHLLNTGLQPVH